MKTYNKIGVLQGRLTPSNGRGIQFFPTENWQNEFKLAKAIGFDCLELLVKETNFKENPLFSESGKKTIRKLAKKHSLETPSIHGFYSKETHYPITLVELLRSGKEVGAQTVLVSFSHENVLKNDDDKKLALKQLEPGVKEAEKIGSRIAIETEMLAPELKTFIESFSVVITNIGLSGKIAANFSNNLILPSIITRSGSSRWPFRTMRRRLQQQQKSMVATSRQEAWASLRRERARIFCSWARILWPILALWHAGGSL